MTMSKEQQDALEALEEAHTGAIELIKSAKIDDQVAVLTTPVLVSPSGFSRAGLYTYGTFAQLLTAASQCVAQMVMIAPDEDRQAALFRSLTMISETVKRRRAGDERPVTSADIEAAKMLMVFPPVTPCPDTKLH